MTLFVNKVPLRVLVVGAGPAAFDLHFPILARLRDQGHIILARICDLDPSRTELAQRKFGFRERCGDAILAITRTDIDLVYIFGSAQMHTTLGLAALNASKHIFIEKPVAPSAALAFQMADTARNAGLIAVGGHNRRFAAAFTALRARAGKAGWRMGEAISHKPEYGKTVPFGARSWLTANGIHALDALLFMMGGLPDHMTAVAGTGSDIGMYSAQMRWPGGAQGSFICNNNAGARREEYAFHAPGETCRVTGNSLTVETAGAPSKTELLWGDGLLAEHEAFLSAVHTGIEPKHSLARLAPSLFLAELIETGFTGAVDFPTTMAAPLETQQQSVLVIEPASLLRAMAHHMPHYRLVSLQDFGDAPRPDIIAIVVGGGSRPLPAGFLDRLPNLKAVGIAALSLDRYAPEPFEARSIAVINASEAYASSVAEFALGLAILGRRRAFASHQVMRAGGWGIVQEVTGWKNLLRRIARKMRPALAAVGLAPPLLHVWHKVMPAARSPGQSRDLMNATVGLIGWGANARAFAKLLIAMGSRVSVWSEHGSADDIESIGASCASLAQVLACEVVSLHRALTPKTRHCLGAPELARLRPGAVLINVARGALIEPNALVTRLQRGDVFACLDTYETEPPSASDRLRRLKNVFLTSHIAGGSPDMHAAAADIVVAKVAAALVRDRADRPPLRAVATA